MGIDTDPGLYAYGNNCLACWDANHTPKYLRVSIRGVEIGPLWMPGMPGPPNGSYLFTQTGVACTWDDSDAPYTRQYLTSLPGSQLVIHFGAIAMFLGFSNDNCVFAFSNNAWQQYTGGIAIVTQVEPGVGPEPAPSLADIMELLNMEGQESRKAEIFPLDNTHLVAMFADQVESTRIRIKYDFS